MNSVYLYIFKDNDCLCDDYYVVTKNDCKTLINDIEINYYDLIDYETKEEMIDLLNNREADERLIDYVKNNEFNTDSCYEFEMDILTSLDEIISCEEHTFYY